LVRSMSWVKDLLRLGRLEFTAFTGLLPILMGSCLAGPKWNKVLLLFVAQLFAQGWGSHALDEMYDRPVGVRFSNKMLTLIAILGWIPALLIGVYFTLTVGWLVVPLALIGFLTSYLYCTGRLHLEPLIALNLATLTLGSYYVNGEAVTLEATLLWGFMFLFCWGGLKVHRLRKYRDKIEAARKALLLLLLSWIPLTALMWIVKVR